MSEKICDKCKKHGNFKRITNKNCDDCLIKKNKKCIHGKRPNFCADCGGTQICKHKRQKNSCKYCRGISLCEHQKVKSQCKDCEGVSLCKHSRIKRLCKLCEGSGLCKHKKDRNQCKECCTNSQICIHKKYKIFCVDCNGKNICCHKKIKNNCVDCNGKNICCHKKEKRYCINCNGSQICKHNKRKTECIICNPKRACHNCKFVYVKPKYRFKPYCFRCYCVLFPNEEIPRRYKLKEHHVRDYLTNEFKQDISMIFDKSVDGGCSKKRPDILIDFGEYVVIGEVDENQHSNYSCENKRMMEIFQDVGNRPCVFIRFNPDSYVSNNVRYKTCFTPTETGYSVDKKEFEKRMKIFVEQIEYFRKNKPTKEIETKELFYDNFQEYFSNSSIV